MSNKTFEYFSKPPFASEELNVLASGQWKFTSDEPRILTFGWLTSTTSRTLWGAEKTTAFNESQMEFVRNQLAFLTSVLNISFVETNDQADLRFGVTSQTTQNASAYAYQSVTSDIGGGYHRDVLMVADPLDPNRLIFNPLITGNGVNGLIHEINHALGIKHLTEGHTIVSDALLQKWYTGTNTAIYSDSRNTFGINDLEYYWEIYGKNLKNSHTDDNTYTFTSGRYDLIYDTRGDDSLIIKGLTTSYSPNKANPVTKNTEIFHFTREININPASYSTIFRDKDLYILDYTFIENVFDSSEGSIIKGNQLSNYIDAGLGSDTVFGGNGDDTIVGGPSSDIISREMVLVKFNEKFNGNALDDAYLKTNKPISLPTNSLKIELVVGFNELPTKWDSTLIGYSSGGEWDNRLFNVYMGSDYLRMWVAGDLYESKIFTPDLFRAGEAVRLTFSWDSLSGSIGAYINGELIDSGTVAKGKSLTAGNFWIGSGWSQIFKGNIGDIAIWSKAMTVYDEKSSLLSSYASLLGDPDLKYLWSASSLNSSGIKSPEFINLKDSNNNLNIVNLNQTNTISTLKIDTSTLFLEDLDVIDGGDGDDTLVVNGLSTNYDVRFDTSAQAYSIEARTGTSGKDAFKNIEFIRFSDKTLAIQNIDVTPPTIAISSTVKNLFSSQTATVNFILSEASKNFVATDVTVTGGTLSNFSGSGTTYSATFTPPNNSNINGVISVPSRAFTDSAGNSNADGSDVNNTLSFSIAPEITYETHSLSVIVNQGVLGASAVLLKELTEKITLTKGEITAHTIEYAGSTFDYKQIDALITTVVRDGEFSDEFRKELTDVMPSTLNLTYKDAVMLVGSANIDNQLIYIAGLDSSFVNTLSSSTAPEIKKDTHTLSVIVDKGVLGVSAALLKELNEKITSTNGQTTVHTVEYAGLIFDYKQIDSLITTVVRDAEFSEEFRKELTDMMPSTLSLTYKDAVLLVGSVNIDNQLIYIAGTDGSYVS